MWQLSSSCVLVKVPMLWKVYLNSLRLVFSFDMASGATFQTQDIGFRNPYITISPITTQWRAVIRSEDYWLKGSMPVVTGRRWPALSFPHRGWTLSTFSQLWGSLPWSGIFLGPIYPIVTLQSHEACRSGLSEIQIQRRKIHKNVRGFSKNRRIVTSRFDHI